MRRYAVGLAVLVLPLAAPPLAAQRVVNVQAELARQAALEADTVPIEAGEVDASASSVALSPAVAQMVRQALAVAAGSPGAAAAELPLRQVTAAETGALVSAERGRPTIFVLYYASCPRSYLTLAYAQEVAERYASTGVQVRAFAYGHTPSEFAAYRERLALSHQPLLLEPWEPGQLTAALEGAGVPLGRPFSQPYVAVLDGEGRAAGSWNVRTVRDFVVAAQGMDAALQRMP